MNQQSNNKSHETVGWRFRGLDGVYLCTRYVRSQGFWMRLLEVGKSSVLQRNVGEEICVSERAIGRTYSKIWQDAHPEPHSQPCECRICKQSSLVENSI